LAQGIIIILFRTLNIIHMMALRFRSIQRALSARAFATAAHEDLSIEGRYATALFDLTKQQGSLENVWADLSHLRDCIKESSDFEVFIQNPVFKADEKEAVISGLADTYSYNPLTVNFLRILLENKRISALKKVVDAFENFYRVEKGQLVCRVSSAKELSSKEQKKVRSALQTRSPNAELIVEYDVNSAIMGGLVVKMGDQVFDFSMHSRLERLQSQLLAPIN